MRVSELFEEESKKVPHGKVVDVLYSLALKYFKAPAAVKQDATRLVRQTDQFWAESFDDVTKELEDFYDEVFDGVYSSIQDFYEAVDNAVNDSVESMREYYSNRMNHPPGYQPTKFQDDNEPLEIPGTEIDKAFAVLSGYTQAVKLNADAEKILAKNKVKDLEQGTTADDIVKVAAMIDWGWEEAFHPKHFPRIAKNAELYDFAKDFVPTTEDDLIKEIIRTRDKSITPAGTVAEWVLDSASKKRKTPSNAYRIISNKNLIKQVIAKSAKLSKYA